MSKSILPTINLSNIQPQPQQQIAPAVSSSRSSVKNLPVTDVSTQLMNIEYKNEHLNVNQITKIYELGLQYNPDVLYEIVCDCFTYNATDNISQNIDLFLAGLTNFTTEQQRTNNELIFNDITFKDQKQQYDNDNDKLRRDTIVRTGISCPNCKSRDTISLEVQMSRGDEGSSQVLRCFNCGRLFKS